MLLRSQERKPPVLNPNQRERSMETPQDNPDSRELNLAYSPLGLLLSNLLAPPPNVVIGGPAV